MLLKKRMRVISDFHLHGRFSRACSKQLTISNLEKWGRIKGLDLLGTGDFTHPVWLKELKTELEEDGSGVARTKNGYPFLLSAEISNIYKQGGKGRRVHNIILAPSFEVVDQINEALLRKGRLDYDGRPIFGFSCVELVDILKGISNDIEIIPAHIWTPWFSLFGSKSGFNTIEECFQEKSKFIHALETGLSSDPTMNWRLSMLDKYTLVSNSDSHSFWPWRIGREANVFEMERLAYGDFIKILREKDAKRFLFTIEVDPSYGKYHFDGHRACGVSLDPRKSKNYRGLCPKCGNPLTIGVLSRIEELADREEGFKPDNAVPYKSLIPLSEIIAVLMGINQPFSKKVWDVHNKLMKEFGSEFNVLLYVEEDRLKGVIEDKIVEGIILNREGKIEVKPGYDGVYGVPLFGDVKPGINEPPETKPLDKQKSLSDF